MSANRPRRATLSGARHLNYDQKYHPMDEELRPISAKKRKLAHLPADYKAEDESDDLVKQQADSDDTASDPSPSKAQQSRRKVKKARQPRRKSPTLARFPNLAKAQEQAWTAGKARIEEWAEQKTTKRLKQIRVVPDSDSEEASAVEQHRNNALLTPLTDTSSNQANKPVQIKKKNKASKSVKAEGVSPKAKTIEQEASAYEQAWEALAPLILTGVTSKAHDYHKAWEDFAACYPNEPSWWPGPTAQVDAEGDDGSKAQPPASVSETDSVFEDTDAATEHDEDSGSEDSHRTVTTLPLETSQLRRSSRSVHSTPKKNAIVDSDPTYTSTTFKARDSDAEARGDGAEIPQGSLGYGRLQAAPKPRWEGAEMPQTPKRAQPHRQVNIYSPSQIRSPHFSPYTGLLRPSTISPRLELALDDADVTVAGVTVRAATGIDLSRWYAAKRPTNTSDDAERPMSRQSDFSHRHFNEAMETAEHSIAEV